MPENLQPESMSTWMRDVDKRLAAVERPSRLSTVQYTNVTEPNQQVAVTSATFVVAWEFNLSQVVADAVSVAAIVDTSLGATAELRVRASTFGIPNTDPVTLNTGLQEAIRFDWIVPEAFPGQTGVFIQLQARRTAGAGNVIVFKPYIAMQVPSYEVDATDDGNGRIL